MKIDDDTLVAYLDAQLEDDAAYEAVEDALAESPALRARLQALAETGSVDAVGIANQRASTIVWDRATGEPVGPGLGCTFAGEAEKPVGPVDPG